ncbi:MAG: UDP-3-O-(3-hydroxymyristoyl)glucosamine N-acyltransferase [Leptospirales bacterium]
MEITLEELSKLCECDFTGDPTYKVLSICDTNRLVPGAKFKENCLYTIENEKLAETVSKQVMGVALCLSQFQDNFTNALVVAKNAEKSLRISFIKALEFFDPDNKPADMEGIHIHPDSEVGANTRIYPGAVIMEGARIGDNCVVYPGAVVENMAQIGNDTVVRSGAVVGRRCIVGNGCTLFENSVIGSDGFGYHDEAGVRYKIPQIGIVRIHDHVDIGACTTIDRATIEDTVIDEHTKIDNQVQVAHNCLIGKYVYIAGKASLSGSVIVKDGAILAGGCGVADHVTIAEKCIILAFTGVHENTEPKKTYFGIPARPVIKMHRINSIIDKLPELAKRVKAIETEVYKEDKE